MKLLIFTEGTIVMHGLAKDVNREERVRQSKTVGTINVSPPISSPGSPYDFKSYIPIGNAVKKINKWKNQGAKIAYLTSRRIKLEVETIKNILKKNHFPDYQHLYFRKQEEEYKDVTERVVPDMIIEDDCESIGGKKEMTYPHIKGKLKTKIKLIVVKEFEGIDHLPDDIKLLLFSLDLEV